MTEQPLDLTSVEVTRRLLAEPWAWRERAVERLSVGSAEFVHRNRSLQSRSLYPLVEDLACGARPSSHAFVILPLGLLPKQPLLRFDVTGPFGQPTLLRRPAIAERQSALLEMYAREAGLDLPDALRLALPVLLAFTEGSWAAVQAQTRRADDPIELYLRGGLSSAPTASAVRRLRVASDRAHKSLDPFNELPADTTSSAESPFLAVPLLVEDGHVDDLAGAVRVVEQYAHFVEAAAAQTSTSSPSAVGDLLSVLADYGRQWELMVLAEVPLDRPFVMTFEHMDPASVRGWRNVIALTVVIADADSNHVTVSVDDPGTRLVGVQGRHPRTGDLAAMGSTSRQTDELHAFYVWENDVDFRVTLSGRLGVLKRVAAGNVLVAVTVLLVAVALALRSPRTLPELAVIAGPTAAAASLLLLREPSTLASRLRLRYSVLNLMSVLVLVGVAVWRFLTLP